MKVKHIFYGILTIVWIILFIKSDVYNDPFGEFGEIFLIVHGTIFVPILFTVILVLIGDYWNKRLFKKEDEKQDQIEVKVKMTQDSSYTIISSKENK
jgi:hypothetical protein